eukprot:3583824-Rhodomonas_salina.1
MHPTRAYVIIFLGLALIIGGLCIVYPVLKRRAEQWRENAPKRDNIAEIKKKRGNITEEGRQKGMWKPQNGKWKWQETNGQGRKRTQLEQRALPPVHTSALSCVALSLDSLQLTSAGFHVCALLFAQAAPVVLDTGPENCSDAGGARSPHHTQHGFDVRCAVSDRAAHACSVRPPGLRASAPAAARGAAPAPLRRGRALQVRAPQR